MRVELPRPAAELGDRTIPIAEQGSGPVDLVLPDRDVGLHRIDQAIHEVGTDAARHVARDRERPAQVHVLLVDRRQRVEHQGAGTGHPLAANGHGTEPEVRAHEAGLEGAELRLARATGHDRPRQPVVANVDFRDVELMHGPEVGRVVVVLGELLNRASHAAIVVARLGPVGIAELGQRGHLEERRLALQVVPDQDHGVALEHFPAVRLRARGNSLRVGNFDALTTDVEAPAVEGTLDGLTDHPAAHTEVRTQVRTVRIEHHGATGLGAEEHEIPREVVDPHDVAGRELVTGRHREPAVGHREGKATGHRATVPRS